MEIIIQLRNGQLITLEVDPVDSIEIVKQKIQSKEGTPTGKQCLVFDGKQLKDSYTLADYNVQNEDILHLVQQRSRPSTKSNLSITYLETLTGKIITFEVDPADSIKSLEQHNLTDEKSNECCTTSSVLTKKCKRAQSRNYSMEQQEPSVRVFLENVATAILDKWQMVGFELDLSVSTIRAIEAERHGNLHRCFAEVFDRWQKHPTPQRPFCWDTVVEVLKSPIIDEPELARKITKDIMN